MENNVTIKTIPVTLTEIQKKSRTWQLRQKFAIEDLECAQQSIQRILKYDIPIQFRSEIILTISIKIRSLKMKIDYSEIKDKKIARAIKLYLARDVENFAKEWFKYL